MKLKKTIPGAYVSKSFTEENIYTGLEMTLMHAESIAVNDGENKVSIKDGYKSRIIYHEDIPYLKTDYIYIEIYTTKTKVISRQLLSVALEKLPKD